MSVRQVDQLEPSIELKAESGKNAQNSAFTESETKNQKPKNITRREGSATTPRSLPRGKAVQPSRAKQAHQHSCPWTPHPKLSRTTSQRLRCPRVRGPNPSQKAARLRRTAVRTCEERGVGWAVTAPSRDDRCRVRCHRRWWSGSRHRCRHSR